MTARLMHLAQALEADLFVPVRDGLGVGEVNVEQAQVIVRAVEDLPDDLDPALTAKAVGLLVADAVLERKLAKEERDAAAAARLTLTKDGHGKVHGRFTLSALHGAMLEKALHALAAPRHRAAVDGHAGPRRPTPERMGRAFAEYLEAYPTTKLPKAGGVAATVVVTIPLATLMGGLKAASLDTGGLLSAGAARRLACRAGIIPMVLGGDSEVLDVARQHRFHPTPIRVAMGIRDGGCTAQGCDWPPGMCHAHHKTPWHQGGGTSLQDERPPRQQGRLHQTDLGRRRSRSTRYSTAISPSSDQSVPGTAKLTIRGVSTRYAGSSEVAVLKWSDCTCAPPASSSANASIRTYSVGSSRLRDQSNQRLPGSSRVASVKTREISGQASACSGLMWNLAVMKIKGVPLLRR